MGAGTHRHLLLRDHDSTGLAPHAHRHDVCRSDRFEGIFWQCGQRIGRYIGGGAAERRSKARGADKKDDKSIPTW